MHTFSVNFGTNKNNTFLFSYSVNTPYLEAQCILLKLPEMRPTFIFSCYRLPDADVNMAITMMSNLVTMLDNVPLKDVILIGDWNIDLLDNSNSKTQVCRMLRAHSLTQLISLPTRVSLAKSSLIDIIAISNTSLYINSGVHILGLSDHDLVLVARKGNKHPKNKKPVKARSFTKYDVNTFRSNLETALSDVTLNGNN